LSLLSSFLKFERKAAQGQGRLHEYFTWGLFTVFMIFDPQFTHMPSSCCSAFSNDLIILSHTTKAVGLSSGTKLSG
jgi:hypothetical protein